MYLISKSVFSCKGKGLNWEIPKLESWTKSRLENSVVECCNCNSISKHINHFKRLCKPMCPDLWYQNTFPDINQFYLLRRSLTLWVVSLWVYTTKPYILLTTVVLSQSYHHIWDTKRCDSYHLWYWNRLYIVIDIQCNTSIKLQYNTYFQFMLKRIICK